eukprot:CAMPEP_0203910582 /NCGR_PEP_ID=MMETSP0359-20131031/51834_1 /ASSEMBLY_ACC=CAM_ASM_000338 /TAXON_ID=268821 /ORGANISM="Scrippsiella Hangoei, Strain SHTV-5" /LENGTH=62 /DNA_ID=CAMNT_0050836101 /DNA_START=276 /DNA_END=464 /DNA_ORIENTATION=-
MSSCPGFTTHACCSNMTASPTSPDLTMSIPISTSIPKSFRRMASATWDEASGMNRENGRNKT